MKSIKEAQKAAGGDREANPFAGLENLGKMADKAGKKEKVKKVLEEKEEEPIEHEEL
jgi:hypothetical protein